MNLAVDRLKVAVFSLDHPASACWQIRVQSPFEFLRKELDFRRGSVPGPDGRNHHFAFPEVLEWADLFLVQRLFPCESTWPLLERVIQQNKPLVYETDDLLISIPVGNPVRSASVRGRPWILKLMQKAGALVVSTPEMKRMLAPYHRSIHVLPNLLDDRLWFQPPAQPSEAEPVVIGFAGTPTHLADLGFMDEALRRLQEKHGSRIHFLFMGCATDQNKDLPNFSFLPFQHSYEAYASGLKGAGIHIGLAPLADNAFNRCKSNIKWLEYSACHMAGVYSDLPPYRACVRDGETGLLVPNTSAAWFEALDALVSEPSRRRDMALRAHQEVAAHFSLSRRGQAYVDTYRALSAQGGRDIPRVAPTPSPGVPLPEALLHRPCWDKQDWVTILLSYLHGFSSGEPVTLIVPIGISTGGHPSLDELQDLISGLVSAIGQVESAAVLIVDGPTALEEALQHFSRVQCLEVRPEGLAPLEGYFGERIAESYKQIKSLRP
ncbi:MAG TPA: glycosyltransferase [Geothrix sp.]|jgi:glycosyltransferase involved in cell wall biosynthesis